jgi:lysophospholipase L1-like esterase
MVPPFARSLPLAASCALACAHAPHSSEVVSPPDPVVRFIGRFDVTDPDRPRFAWSASAIATRFAGRSLHVRLKDTGYDELQVVIDGAPAKILAINPSREDYEVVAASDGAMHELLLTKRTEARMGELQFLGFDPPPPATPPPGHASHRRIELIGDSITAGYGDEGGGANCAGETVSFENEYVSYGAVASRSLGAEHVTVAWAGKTTEEMSKLYERTLPSHADSHWDFKRWTPDAIVVNLGTNDFNRGDPGRAAFVHPYVTFLLRLRAIYPDAKIVCALGPMLTDSYPPGVHALTRARAYITLAVAEARAAGDPNVSFLEFPTQDPANGRGCDYHPSKKTHALMGEQLAAALREKLQW